MKKLVDTTFYQDAIHEINYPFGNYYLFDGFVLAEVNEGVIFTWENHGKIVTEDLTNLYDTNGRDVIFLTNRINSYSLKPTDWIHFFRQSYNLKGYAVIAYSKTGYLNALLEKLFMSAQFKRFRSLEKALEWASGFSDNQRVLS